MAVTRYSTQVDLGNLNSSHALAILSVAPGSRVLDLGAADGSVARRLKERSCAVWAVEFNSAAADAARQVCDQVITGDLEADDVWRELEGQTFDAILALDVLEHLRQPETALRKAANHLGAEGVIVVSIPNITHAAIRLSLLDGRFRYQETGPLDRTHLRFFDRRGAEQLVQGAGLVITERLRVSRALHETEVPVTTDGVASQILDTISRDPDATTYQFVFVARREGGAGAAPSGVMLSERLLGELEGLRARFTEMEQYAQNLASDRERLLAVDEQQRLEHAGMLVLQADLERRMAELRAELERRMTEAHQRQLELRHSKADLAVKQAFIDDLRGRRQTENREFETEMNSAREAATALQARVTQLEEQLRRFQLYANSAGFRLVEGVISRLKRIPFIYAAARAAARALAGVPRHKD